MPPRSFRDGQIDARTEWRTVRKVLFGHSLVYVDMTSCGKIETTVDSLQVTGAKGDLFPGSFMSTGANAPVAPVESAPMM